MLGNKAFAGLQKHYAGIRSKKIKNLFDEDAGDKRGADFTYQLDNLTADFSKNLITKETIDLFATMAEDLGIKNILNAAMTGEKINFTEQKAVGHYALRNKNLNSFIVDGVDYSREIRINKEKMYEFCRNFRSGKIKGYTGKPFDTVVNIGIGGSYLGTKMAYNALKDFNEGNIQLHFISNIDAANLIDVLSYVDPETTLFVVASKTFTTQETLYNANTIKEWFLQGANASNLNDVIAKHFVALSTNLKAVEKFGITKEYTFAFNDFIGGRFSLWSSVGLPLLLSIGEKNFEEFLNGAFIVDNHTKTAPFKSNIPFLMASIGVWNNNILNYKNHGLIAYDYRLAEFSSYLQQLEMESNGKSTSKKGSKVFYNTCPVVFGGTGTDTQHSVFQFLHQGSHVVPCDFIGFINPSGNNYLYNHHDALLANMFAQAEALMVGKTREKVSEELKKHYKNYAEYSSLVNHKVFEGNRPSNILLFDSLTPKSLGMLCALYENKVLLQGIIWDINSFDQYGVELGKKLGNDILKEIKKEETTEDDLDPTEKLDISSSSDNLIKLYKTKKVRSQPEQ